jgi:hypothetical protein
MTWHCMTLHDIAWHCMTLHDIAWHCMTSTTWNPWGFQANVSINFGLWIIYFSRSGISFPSGSQIITWSVDK